MDSRVSHRARAHLLGPMLWLISLHSKVPAPCKARLQVCDIRAGQFQRATGGIRATRAAKSKTWPNSAQNQIGIRWRVKLGALDRLGQPPGPGGPARSHWWAVPLPRPLRAPTARHLACSHHSKCLGGAASRPEQPFWHRLMDAFVFNRPCCKRTQQAAIDQRFGKSNRRSHSWA